MQKPQCKLTKGELRDLGLMAGKRAVQCLLDALQLVDDPQQRVLLLFRVEAALIAFGSRLVQEYAKTEGENIDWACAVSAFSKVVEAEALAMKPAEAMQRWKQNA